MRIEEGQPPFYPHHVSIYSSISLSLTAEELKAVNYHFQACNMSIWDLSSTKMDSSDVHATRLCVLLCTHGSVTGCIMKNHFPSLSCQIIGSKGNMHKAKTFGSLGCCAKPDWCAWDDIPEVIWLLRCPRHNDLFTEEMGLVWDLPNEGPMWPVQAIQPWFTPTSLPVERLKTKSNCKLG